MHIVLVCEGLGWTYFDYMNQPNWFVKTMEAKREFDIARSKDTI